MPRVSVLMILMAVFKTTVKKHHDECIIEYAEMGRILLLIVSVANTNYRISSSKFKKKLRDFLLFEFV